MEEATPSQRQAQRQAQSRPVRVLVPQAAIRAVRRVKRVSWMTHPWDFRKGGIV